MPFRSLKAKAVSTLAALALVLSIKGSMSDEPLVADLSDHLVAITTGFTGTDLLLFGSVDQAGDIIVTVHGPRDDVVVRKKERVAGVWANTEQMQFSGAPSFYHVAMTEGAASLIPAPISARHEVGAENLRFAAPDTATEADVDRFRAALIRNKQTLGLYTETPGRIEMRGERLFRTNVSFPANVPVGTYEIETLLIRSGQVVSAQTTPLFVSKTGAGAEIYRFAYDFPALHGILAILIAVLAGLGANWIFTRLG